MGPWAGVWRSQPLTKNESQYRNKYFPVRISIAHDDVIKWKHFPRYWPVVRGIHPPPPPPPHPPPPPPPRFINVLRCGITKIQYKIHLSEYIVHTQTGPRITAIISTENLSCQPQMGPLLAPWTLLSGMWDRELTGAARITKHMLSSIVSDLKMDINQHHA